MTTAATKAKRKAELEAERKEEREFFIGELEDFLFSRGFVEVDRDDVEAHYDFIQSIM